MMSLIRTSTATLLISTALSTAAWADLTAEQVWKDLRERQNQDKAAEFTFDDPVREGNALIINNVVQTSRIKQKLPDDDGDHTMQNDSKVELGTIKLTEQGDGTVSLDVNDEIRMSFSGSGDDEDDKYSVAFKMTLENDETIVSENGDAMRYESSVDVVTVAMTDFDFDGETEFTVMPEATLNDVTNISEQSSGDLRQVASKTTAGKITFKMAATGMKSGDDDEDEASGPASIKVDYTAEDLATDFIGTLPLVFDSEDPKSFFSDDTNLSGTLTIGAADGSLEFQGPDGDIGMTGSSKSQEAGFGLSEGAISLSSFSHDFMHAIKATDFPFPIEISGDEAGFAMTMPMRETTEPADFSLKIAYDQIELNDAVWTLIDNRNALPHTPLTIRAAFSGAINVLADLFDSEAIDKFEDSGNPAIYPQNIEIDELTFRGVGLDIDGSGSLEFPEDAVDTDDMVPVGSIELTAVGANGLLEKLGEAGVIPSDQAAMQQMMLGMFAEKIGEDKLRSVFEFKEGGEITANGQRIR